MLLPSIHTERVHFALDFSLVDDVSESGQYGREDRRTLVDGHCAVLSARYDTGLNARRKVRFRFNVVGRRRRGLATNCCGLPLIRKAITIILYSSSQHKFRGFALNFVC